MAIGPVQNQGANPLGEYAVEPARNNNPAQAAPEPAQAQANTGGDTVTITPEAGAMQEQAQAAAQAAPAAAAEAPAAQEAPEPETPTTRDMVEEGRDTARIENANQQQAVNSGMNTETVRQPDTINLIA